MSFQRMYLLHIRISFFFTVSLKHFEGILKINPMGEVVDQSIYWKYPETYVDNNKLFQMEEGKSFSRKKIKTIFKIHFYLNKKHQKNKYVKHIAKEINKKI